MRSWLGPTLCLVLAACQGGGDKPTNTGGGSTTPAGTPGGSEDTPPRAENDLADVVEGGSVNVNVASNDLVTSNPLALGSVTVVDPPQFGSVTTQTNGTVDYTHDGGETTSDSFTYWIEDSSGITSNTATVLVSVDPVNDPPVAVDDAANLDQNEVVVVDLGGNDVDVDDGLNLGSIAIVTWPTHGALSMNGDGTVDYDHDGSAFVSDSFSYTIADGAGAVSNTASVDLTITTNNVPPIAVDDFEFVTEGGALNLPVVYNDLDVDDGIDPSSVTIASPPVRGSVTVQPDGSIDYQHDGSENPSDGFSYTVSDLAGSVSNTAYVQLAVISVNDPPTANPDFESVSENQSVNVRVLLNDVDVDSAIDPFSVAVVNAPTVGTVFVNLDGTIDYTHDGTQAVSDSFTYRVSDTSGAMSNLAVVDVSIGLSNDPPDAADDVAAVNEGGSVLVDVVANDTDPDDAVAPATVTIVTAPGSGSVVVNGDGTVQYTHDGSEGVADSFVYTVEDTLGNVSAPATVAVTVTPVNDPPTGAGDFYVVAEGSVNNVLNVLFNDADVDDGLDITSVAIDSAPSNGTATANADGTITYSHDGSYTISDSFTYHVLDASGASSGSVVVNLSVLGNNDPPSAGDDSYVVAEGGSAPLSVLLNDGDIDDGLDLTSIGIVSQPAFGSVVVNAGGTVTYTHDGSESGADSFSYLVRDLSGLISNVATVALTITPVNDPPNAVADLFGVAEGAGAQLDVQANDTDADDGIDSGSVVIDTPPSSGTASVLGNGRVSYTHDGSETVTDSFTYHLSDNSGQPSASAVVTVTVTPVNDPPVAVNDQGSMVNEGGQVNIPVIANDSDADDGLAVGTVTIVTAPAAGTATPQPNGVVLYQHGGGEGASDSFTYRVKDASGVDSNVATVQVGVNPVNDVPLAVADSYVVAEGSTGNVLPVLTNDSDADDGLDVTSVVIDAIPTHGIVVANGDGTVTYDHDGSPTPSDSFAYHVSDASGATSASVTVSLTISAVNNPPVAVNDSGMMVSEGSSANLVVLGNDTDPDDGIDPSTVTLVTAPTRGVAVVNGDGTVLYTHNGSETLSDSFTYTVRDFTGATSNIATTSIVVTPVNDAPVATNSSEALNEGAIHDVNVLNDASDVDDGLNSGSVVVVSGPANGTASVIGGGIVRYTHNGGETASDSFTWRISDMAGAQSNVATVNLTIVAVNDAPVAVNDADTVSEGGSKFVAVLGNDSDPDDGLNAGSLVVVSAPSNGTATPSGGSIQYVHNGSETASDSFTYRVSDASGTQSGVATVTITVSPVNDPPVAVADGPFSVNEGAARNVVVLTNDSDPDNAIAPATVTVTSAPSYGSATARPDGTIDYTHNGSEVASDSFTYRVSDASGAVSNVVSVSMTITAVNDAPVAVNDSGASFAVAEGSVAQFQVLTNDSDADDGINPNSLAVVSGPTRGTLSILMPGVFTYAHDGSDFASDSFTYRVSDYAGALSNTATVSVTVNAVNDAPVAVNDSSSVGWGGIVQVNVVGNDYDVDGTINPATVTITSAPGQGIATANANGTVDYWHTGGAGGLVNFTYTVRDNGGATSNTATVSVTVGAAPANAPVAVNDSFPVGVNPGSSINVNLAGNDYDADNNLNLASIQVVSQPMFGTATPQANGTLTYQHSGGYQYNDVFGYRIYDATGLASNVAWVSLRINTSCVGVAYFGPSASLQSYALPACVPAMDVEVFGSVGAGDNPGFGGYAYGQLLIPTPGMALYLQVGDNAGAGGGGYGPYYIPMWGGGATDVRLGGGGLENRVIVAGGGGAGGNTSGYYYENFRGGDGGGGDCGPNWCGGGEGHGWGGPGVRGGLFGGAGLTTSPHSGGAGGAGFQSGGGGSCQSWNAYNPYYYATSTCGGTGTLGEGGDGDTYGAPLCYSAPYGGTKGGGGGYYGGGGSSTGYCGGGAGGGGSTWTGDLAYPSMAGGVNAGLGEAILLWGETRSGLAGRFDVGAGPSWSGNPAVVSCVETCALLFGGVAGDYNCSTLPTSIDYRAYVTGWGDGQYCAGAGATVSETFKLDQGTGYDCGGGGCSYSAFASDHCSGSYNYCWR